MNTWAEQIDGLLRNELLQLEMLCRNFIESLPFLIGGTIGFLLVVLGLLAAMNRMFLQDEDLPQSKGSEIAEPRSESSADSYSEEPATTLLRSDTVAAA